MRGVCICVHQRDHDRGDILLPQYIGKRQDLGFVERHEHVATVVEALGHLPAAIARNERLLHAGEAVHRRPVSTAELERVAEAAGSDERAARSLALDHRVGRDRRAVQQRFE